MTQRNASVNLRVYEIAEVHDEAVAKLVVIPLIGSQVLLNANARFPIRKFRGDVVSLLSCYIISREFDGFEAKELDEEAHRPEDRHDAQSLESDEHVV